MSLKKVLLVGANGTLGTHLLDGLIAANTFDVSVAKRQSSTSTLAYTSSVNIVNISDDISVDNLIPVLRGQDAVVASFPLDDVSQHLHLAEAAAKAGVQRFIPADFGSCDAQDYEARRHLKLYSDKDVVREKAVQLVKEYPSFSWTSIVCGHFFDWGIRNGLLHTDLETSTAMILDRGDVLASASTLRRVAEALVAVLQRPDVTKNRLIYVQSFCKTQLDVVAALEKATGTRWAKEFVDSKAYMERESRKLSVDFSMDALANVVFILGQLYANWPAKKDAFMMEELGLCDEDLDQVIQDIVDQWRKEQRGDET